MQLIEIVQLALVGFVLIILIIFLVSYISYRTTKKNRSNSTINNSNIIYEDSKSFNQVSIYNQADLEKPITKENKIQKFQVFNPNQLTSERKNPAVIKKHFPHTLIINK